MNDAKKREEFWSKIKEKDRSFAWFHRNYLSGCKLSYNTLYKQAKGQELTVMSHELREAINNYLAD